MLSNWKSHCETLRTSANHRLLVKVKVLFNRIEARGREGLMSPFFFSLKLEFLFFRFMINTSQCMIFTKIVITNFREKLRKKSFLFFNKILVLKFQIPTALGLNYLNKKLLMIQYTFYYTSGSHIYYYSVK